MDRETTLLLALGMLIAAALVVGVGGWVLFVRDRRPTKTALAPASVDTAHHREAVEGS